MERPPSPTPSTSAATTSTASSPRSTELHLNTSQTKLGQPHHPSSRFRHVPFRAAVSSHHTSASPALAKRPSPLSSQHRSVPHELLNGSSLPSDNPTLKITSPPPLPFQHSVHNDGSSLPFDIPRNPSGTGSLSSLPSHNDNSNPHRSLQAESRSPSLNSPYRPGFQPRGVYRYRTDDYLTARDLVKKEGQVERQRLERRLEKVIAIDRT